MPQADLSLRWTHNHFVGFVMSWLKYACLVTCSLTTHEDHTSEDITDFAAVTRKELRLLLDEGKEFRFSIMKELEESKSYGDDLVAKKEHIVKSVFQRKEKFHHAVDKICNDILEKLEKGTNLECERIEQDQDELEKDLMTLSNRIATANQIIDFGSDIDIARKKQDIIGSLWSLKKEIPMSLSPTRLDIDFSCQEEAEISLRYLLGRLTMDILPPNYIDILEVSSFRVEDSADVINSICPSPDGKCWVVCGWKGTISLYDRFGQKSRSKRVGRDVDCLAVDSDGNSYVSCRDEHAVKRFSRNYKRRMASLNINYPRGIATTCDNKLVLCANETTTYFDYSFQHKNKVLKLGPDGDESKELKNPSLKFMYPIRVAVNVKDNLCVSDNIQHAVLFLKPNGELRSVYTGQRKDTDIAIVNTQTPRKAITGVSWNQQTSTPKPGAASFRRINSRKEDKPKSAPLSRTQSVLDKTKTPPNSPKSGTTNEKALAPLNLTYGDSTTDSSTILESPRKKSAQKWKALATFTDGMETASMTEVGAENLFVNSMAPFDPRGITCDRYGHVIVADYSSNLIHLLDKHGRFLMYLLTEADGIFAPTSVAVDKTGFLWVGGGDATIKIYRYISSEIPSFF